MPIFAMAIPALVAGGAAVAGDVMSSNSAAAANQQSYQNQLQAEQWQTQMSDTAMQRRAADLQAAGLNPALAVGQGGASTPGISPASAMNTGQAFGNLGGQISSAIDLGQKGTLINAQASNLNASATASAASANKDNVLAAKAAGVDSDSIRQGIDESQSRIALNSVESQARAAQASLSLAQVKVADATLPKIQAEMDNIRAATSVDQVRRGLVLMQGEFQAMNNAQFQYLAPSIVQSAANAAKLSSLQIPEGQSRADFWTSEFGKASPYLSMLGNAIGAVLGGASKVLGVNR